MKIIYLISCSSISDSNNEITAIDCPRVFFSIENNIYIDSKSQDLDLEKVNYKASLNNYGFASNCVSDSINNIYSLDLLIISEPYSPKTSVINLPIFVLLYDIDDNVIDKQYFRVNENLNFNDETSEYQITEIISNLKILLDSERKVNYLTIGFVNIN